MWYDEKMNNRYTVDSEKVLDAYPRPQLKRKNWTNLNGFWDCAFTKNETFPEHYPLRILVPFSPETKLSGIERILQPKEYLHYRKTFFYMKKERTHLILHFGAVDYQCKVYLNKHLIGEHEGGYLPFSFDITGSIRNNNELCVIVTDPSDTEGITKGKQRLESGGIFYPCQSGIWQTVWLEKVPSVYIKNIIIDVDFSNSCFSMIIQANKKKQTVKVSYLDNKKTVMGKTGQRLICSLDAVHAWTPEDPYLYGFTVQVGNDLVESYVGMRSFGIEGTTLLLNGKPYFHHGILDQGYWKDSLYTPPNDQAMIDDIRLAKKLGFNMIRKHVKVEPLRWYYHCDRLGILVWQDMVNGGGNSRQPIMSAPLFWPSLRIKDSLFFLFGRGEKKYRIRFEQELKAMVSHLYNVPCIAMWVIFNEGWGQFNAKKLLHVVQQLDTSRTIDPTSGWYDQGIGDFASKHLYYKPYSHERDKKGRCTLLSEFGGYVWRVSDHDTKKKVFGYKTIENREAFNEAFIELYLNQIVPAKKLGLAASVYTQLSDVEQEINGLITYDRLQVKLDVTTGLVVAASLLGNQHLEERDP